MADSSPAYRCCVALLGLIFGLGWAAPLGYATDVTVSSVSVGHFCTSAPTTHCGAVEVMPSAECLSHHANQDALSADTTVPDESVRGEAPDSERSGVPFLRITDSSLSSNRRAVPHAERRHVRVGMWHE